jgi:lactate racemase
MAEINFPWDDSELTLRLPDRWAVQQLAQADLKPASSDWPQLLAAALSEPGTGPTLSRLLRARGDGRIVIVVEDITRGGPVADILSVMMREIRFARIAPERVEIVFATGMHPPMMPSHVALKLGEGEPIRWRCNPCDDRSAYVNVGRIGKMDLLVDRGVAQADLRIIVSSVSPHFQAGFGGGYRLLVPGCAHAETIRKLNRLGMEHPDRRLVGVPADANPMRSAIDAAGVLLDQRQGRSFAAQYLLDAAGLPTSIVTGEVIPTQRMLAKQCAVACGVVTGAPADVLITNAHPRDFDLCQSLKCIANTRWAVRPGGVIFCLTDTRIALRDMRLPTWPIGPVWTRRALRLVGAEAVCSLARRLAPGLAEDADPYFRWAASVLHRNPIVMYAPFLADAKLNLPGIRLEEDIDQAISRVEELLPAGRIRVNAFPSGGSTFPILPERTPTAH